MAELTFDQLNWKPSHNPWAVALTVTLATFMEVLDTSIANVALPHMAGSPAARYGPAPPGGTARPAEVWTDSGVCWASSRTGHSG